MALSFPPSDNALLAWSANFLALLTASPTTYGITIAMATAYGAVHADYATNLAACDPNARNKSSVVAKNQSRINLKAAARLLSNTINGVATVTDAQKTALGLNVRAKPSPIPAPSDAPGLDIVSVYAWTVKIKLHDSAAGSKRGRPAGVSGAGLFSFVGDIAPTNIALWNFEGNVGKTIIDIAFDSSNPSGTKVWFTAFWFNNRKQSGPACPPASTNLQGGSVSLAA